MKKKNEQHIRTRQLTRLLTVLILGLIGLVVWMVVKQPVNRVPRSYSDKLAYTVHDGSIQTLKLYDPATGDNRTLIHDYRGGHFALSADGRIAYTDWDGDTRQIYVMGNTVGNSTPVNITSELVDGAQLIYSRAWSPGNRYLAYQANYSLYLWDSKLSESFDITPISLKEQSDSWAYYAYQVSWYDDNLLAIHVRMWLGSPDIDMELEQSEIYLWNSNQTLNVSQNLEAWEGIPAWSTDGQLAYTSANDGQRGIFIWDGQTYRDGVPDKASFQYIDYDADVISWTSDNRLIMDSVRRGRRSWQKIHFGDGQTAQNFTHLSDVLGSDARWSADGRWAFLLREPDGSFVIVRDTDNQEIARFFGQMALAWSGDGQLAYSSGHRSLSVWNGHEHILLTDDTWETFAQWQNGASMHFSFWVG